MGAVPDLTIEPMAFSTMFDSPPFLLPGVVLALRSTPPRARYLSYQPSSAMSARATSGLAARAVSCATPSRTSVFSENMTVNRWRSRVPDWLSRLRTHHCLRTACQPLAQTLGRSRAVVCQGAADAARL